MQNVIAKYLQTHAEWNPPPPDFEATWDEAVVIPCFGENHTLDCVLSSIGEASDFSRRRVLVVVLVNGDNLHADYGSSNRGLLSRLCLGAVQDEHLFRAFWRLGDLHPSLDVLVLDRTFEGEVDGSQGVGWARKYGCDLVLGWIFLGRIKSEWIHTTDADARVEQDYFELTGKESVSFGLGKKTGAYVHPYCHRGAEVYADVLVAPIALYDAWLRYYEAGLRYAGSPYAFPMIGSLISVSAQAYAEVRGFPKNREAAEDFYLLTKVAKISQVVVGGGRVILENRESRRVPFGTGVGVAKISRRLDDGGVVTFYHPETFFWLKHALDTVSLGTVRGVLPHPSFPQPVQNCLATCGYFDAMNEAFRRKTPADRVRTFHSQWDGFKTLKFVHAYRERISHEIPWRSAIEGLRKLESEPAPAKTERVFPGEEKETSSFRGPGIG